MTRERTGQLSTPSLSLRHLPMTSHREESTRGPQITGVFVIIYAAGGGGEGA